MRSRTGPCARLLVGLLAGCAVTLVLVAGCTSPSQPTNELTSACRQAVASALNAIANQVNEGGAAATTVEEARQTLADSVAATSAASAGHQALVDQECGSYGDGEDAGRDPVVASDFIAAELAAFTSSLTVDGAELVGDVLTVQMLCTTPGEPVVADSPGAQACRDASGRLGL